MPEEKFPIDLIELVLVKGSYYDFCQTCRHIAPYTLFFLIDDPKQLMKGGQSIVNFESIWSDMIRRQQNDDFTLRHSESLCKQHAVQNLSIALGRVEPVIAMISALDAQKELKSISVFCSVTSFEDEGNTWIGISPYAEISDIRKYLLKKKQKEGLK